MPASSVTRICRRSWPGGTWRSCRSPRNEATKSISPTKTLEYMAAGKPVVSTPIADVVAPYGDVVGLGDTADEFVAACEKALAETPADRERRRSRFADILAGTSWDATAAAMAELIEAAALPRPDGEIAAGRRRRGRADGAECRVPPRRGRAADRGERHGRRLVPLAGGPRVYLRLGRSHHVLERPLRPRDVQGAAGRQRPLAGPRGVDLQQKRLHAVSVPGVALRPAAGGHQGVRRSGPSRPATAAPRRLPRPLPPHNRLPRARPPTARRPGRATTPRTPPPSPTAAPTASPRVR